MDPHISTTPFGRRPLSLAMVASQATADECPRDIAVHKWQVFRALCEAKDRFGVTERSLAILNALLTFHPETVLTGQGELIVFPSNAQLSLRAHGMAPATLRRHLAALVEAGLIIRRDSPNGKRYTRKDRQGGVMQAFGFDLKPLVARASEIERAAEAAREDRQRILRLREQVTILRRDITKMIAAGAEEGLPGDWASLHADYQSLFRSRPKASVPEHLEAFVEDLRQLHLMVRNLLQAHIKSQDSNVNESQNERHIQNSKPDSDSASEQDFRGSLAETSGETPLVLAPQRAFPLPVILDACPDIRDYAKGGVSNWQDLRAAAELVRGMLGISPSAWEEARAAMGADDAAIVIAAILQKGDAISKPGGYLRTLTERQRNGEFSIGRLIMSLLSRDRRHQRAS